MTIEEIAELYGKRLYREIARRCRDNELAKDLLQETLLQVYLHCSRGQYREQGKLWGWLQSIAQNLVTDYYRNLGRHRTVLNAGHGEICENMGWRTEDAERETGEPMFSEKEPEQLRIERIREHIGGFIRDNFKGLHISEKERSLLSQRYRKSKGFQDMADETGEPLSTMLGRHNSAIGKVRSELLALDAAGVFAPGGLMERMNKRAFEDGDRRARRRVMDKLWPLEPVGKNKEIAPRRYRSGRPPRKDSSPERDLLGE